MTPDTVVRSFAAFLASGWKEMSAMLDRSDSVETLIADWMQASWETLVEPVLLPDSSDVLEVYGDGADCYGFSSRIFRPRAAPTHRIVCFPLHGDYLKDLGSAQTILPSELSFWGFVRWNGEVYEPAPEFNAVLLEGECDIVVGLEEVEFKLEEIQ